jgi:hypothetical protein
MESKTQMGLQFIIIGSIMVMLYTLITSVTFLFTRDFETMAFISVLGIVSFIGAILILIGAILFLMGRKEFGEKHQRNVKYAAIIFVIYIAFTVIITIAIAFVVYLSISSMSVFDSNTFLPYFVIQIIIGAILGSLMYYFALIELEDELGKKFLFAGIISSICISIIKAIYYAGLFGELFESISSISPYSSLNIYQNFGAIEILGVIPWALLIIAIYIPYKRIKEGKLIPQFLSSQSSTIPGRICPNCGRPIPYDSLLCSYCGKEFK